MLGRILEYKNTAIRELARGELLFDQGDSANAIFEVTQGILQLVRHARDGRMLVVHTARSGEVLAEAALFSSHYHCSAVAAQRSTVRSYPKALVLAELRRDPEKMEPLLAHLARRVHALRLQLEIRNIRSAKSRLLLHLELHGDPITRKLKLDGPLQNLAPELGLTREALYRAVAALEARGTIKKARGYLQLR